MLLTAPRDSGTLDSFRLVGDVHIRIKICGITRPEDGIAAARLGVDAVGLVFYPPSPRAVTCEQAAEVIAALPPLLTTVGLFVNPDPVFVEEVLERVPLGMLQFHGDETPADCRQFHRPYLKAVRMREGVELERVMIEYNDAAGILLDAYQPGTYGGTGARFDWTRIPSRRSRPIVLAGGLTPENVGDAIRRTRPEGVDVSGGVESAKGVKDVAKIAAFVQGVRNAEGS